MNSFWINEGRTHEERVVRRGSMSELEWKKNKSFLQKLKAVTSWAPWKTGITNCFPPYHDFQFTSAGAHVFPRTQDGTLQSVTWGLQTRQDKIVLPYSVKLGMDNLFSEDQASWINRVLQCANTHEHVARLLLY